MQEHIKEIVDNLPLIMVVGAFVIYVSGLGLKQHFANKRIDSIKTSLDKLEEKHTSLEAAFHQTQISHSEQLSKLVTAVEYITRTVDRIATVLDNEHKK